MTKNSSNTRLSQRGPARVNTKPLDKVLFLDIDGVLFLGVSSCSGPHGSDPLHMGCVRALNEIIEKTRCSIVITSSWQNEYTIDQLTEIFQWNGISETPIQLSISDTRAFASHEERAREILDWLSADTNRERTGSHDFRWCVVDDMDLGSLPNFVKCDGDVGLNDKTVVSAIIATLNS